MENYRKIVDVGGDLLVVQWDGNVWVSPHNGKQHARAADAMRDEIEAYILSCGESPSAEEVDEYLSQMVDE